MKKSLSVSLATFLAFWQVGFALVPFLTTQTAYAANEITASNHEGQLKPSGSYSSGNITTYAELDYINYRFTLDSSAVADGQMQIRFSGVETTGQACTFFQQTFSLGTHDSSAASVVPVSGSTPTVSTVGMPTASGDEWVQVLDVDFAGAGQAVVNYYLTLTDEAGDCGGSSQHSRLNNVSGPTGGDFANIGAQNVPIPAKDIIELATITVTKYIDENGDGQSDRTATAGEWSFSLEGGTPVATNASGQVVFSNLQTGDYDINESGPADYSFISVSGENCVPGNLSGTAVASIIAAPTATDASCDFFNGIRPAHIIVQKETLPDGNQQSFAFTSNYGNGFNLSDGGSNDSGNLLPGTYSVSETVPSGWDLTNITCSDGSNPTSINLAAGETVTCVFTNTKRGHLIVQKTTLPSGDQTQFSILATGNGSITGGGSGTITDALDKDYEVTPGTYSVSETEPDGWTKTDNTCQDVVVAPGATAYCTITNRKKATLTIVKDALPADTNDLFSFTSTGGLSPAAFDLDDSASTTAPLDSKQFSLEPGDYSVTETVPTGWKLTELNCEGSDGFSWPSQTSRLEISLAAGDTVTCKFTNTKYGSISGFKFEVDADGSFADTLEGWTINLLLDGAFYGSSTTLGDGSYGFLNLLPGDYTVEEVNQDGWTQISDTEDCAENYEIGLLAGENSTDNNFCNFENGSLSGYKFEDKDADGNYEPGDGETKLPDWPFYFYYDEDNNGIFDEAPTPFTTDQDGNFSFDNLAPGEYQICEDPQTALGWVRTTPVTSNCRTTEINISSESVTNLKFGNQGRGTIQVFKDVDTDGDGDIDEYGSSGWTWDLGSTNFATGSAAQNVAAGDYTVHEDQQTDYHFTGVVCTKSGEEFKITQAETTFVTVEPGDEIVCTFTNTRDRGTLRLIKHVENDNNGTTTASDFTLHITQNDTDVAGSPAAGSETGTVYGLVTGIYSVSEDTPVTGYEQVSIVCDGQTTATVTVTTGTEKVCTITNNDKAPTLTLVKEVVSDNSGTAEADDFVVTADPTVGSNISGNGGASDDAMANTPYSLSESGPAGYHVKTDWNCTGGGSFDAQANTITLALDEDVTCTIVNDDDAHPGIQLVKTGPAVAHENDNVAYTFTVENTGDEPLSNITINDPLITTITYVSGDTNSNDVLDVDETWTYTANYTIPTNQIANVVNTATVCGDPRVGDEVCDDDDHTIDVLHPSITVEKDGPLLAYEGQVVGYSFVVTNTGDTTLYNVNISDDIASDETCDDSTLAPAASTNCTAIYLIPTPTEDNVINTVDACGVDILQLEVCDDDNHTLDVIHPSVHILKTGPATAHEGDTVTYTFTVTNTGDVPLSSVTVNDNIAGPATYVSGDTNTDDKLDLNETWTYTADYLIPAEQTTNVDNTATACGLDPIQAAERQGEPVCDDDDHSLDVLHPSLQVIKSGPDTANPGDEVTYTFTVTNTGDTPLSSLTANDSIAGNGTYQSGDTNNNDELDLTETWTYAATYVISSDQAENIDNTVTVCGEDSLEAEVCDDDDHHLIVLAKIIVTKYNDLDRDGQYDETADTFVTPEPALSDWGFRLTGDQACEELSLNQLLDNALSNDFCVIYDYDKTQTTGDDGTTTFTGVRPYIGHELSETLQDGWHLSNIHCSGDERGIFEDDEYYVYASPGETVECFVGNYRDPALTIAKSNNRPNPTSTGDTVTYTITVSVPENSGAVFDAIVQDLPPEGFSYVAGSWTASSSVRGDLKAAGTTTEPDYGSPGEWFLGNMLPSEIVTLTYKALIGSTVSAGTYPDVAFAIGCDIPNTEGDCDVLSNVSTGADTPFVGTKVTINAPQVLGTTTTILVETGTAIWQSLVVGGGLLIAALATLARRPQKGGLS